MSHNYCAFRSTYDRIRKLAGKAVIPASPAQFYHATLQSAYHRVLHDESSKGDYNQCRSEAVWHELGKPYYNLHPRLSQAFQRAHLNFPADYIGFPYEVFVVQFADDDPLLALPDGAHRLRSCLVTTVRQTWDVEKDCVVSDSKKIIIWMDFGEEHEIHGRRVGGVYVWRQLAWKTSQETLEDAINTLSVDPSYHIGLQIPADMLLLAVKLCVSLGFLLMDKDAGALVLPHLLKKDWPRYAAATEEERYRLHCKAAAARGGKGWLVGDVEAVDLGRIGPAEPAGASAATGRTLDYAHMVMGHWKLVRYGTGRKQGRVRWITPYVRAADKPFKHVTE